MGNQVKGLVVTFEQDFSEEVAQEIANAIVMMKGVAKAESVPLDVSGDYLVRTRAEMEIKGKLFNFLNEFKLGE